MRVAIMMMIYCHVKRGKSDGCYISVYSNLKHINQKVVIFRALSEYQHSKASVTSCKNSGELSVDRRQTSAGVK